MFTLHHLKYLTPYFMFLEICSLYYMNTLEFIVLYCFSWFLSAFSIHRIFHLYLLKLQVLLRKYIIKYTTFFESQTILQ